MLYVCIIRGIETTGKVWINDYLNFEEDFEFS